MTTNRRRVPRRNRQRRLSTVRPRGRRRLGRTPGPGCRVRRKAPSSRPRPGPTRSACWSGRPSPGAQLAPIRYGRMPVSPFTFFRGAALIMATDLAATPSSVDDADLRRRPPEQLRAVRVTERAMMFDVNDFDETLPGPWEWDLKRLAASVVIAGRDQRFSPKDCGLARGRSARPTGGRCSAWPRRATSTSGTRTSTSRRSSPDLPHRPANRPTRGSPRPPRAMQMAYKAQSIVAKSRTKDSMQAQDKLTEVVAGRRRIISDRPLIVPLTQLEAEHAPDEIFESLHQLVRSYRRTLQTDRRHLLEGFECRRHRPQGRGRRQCRNPRLLDPLVPGP